MAIKVFRPHTLGIDEGFSPVGAATEVEACDPGESEAHDDDTSYAAIGSGSVNLRLGFKPDTAFSEKMAAVNSVTVKCRPRLVSGSDVYNLQALLGANTQESGDISIDTGYTTDSYDISSLRPGGGSWAESDFRDNTFEWRYKTSAVSAGETRITSLYVYVDFVPSSAKIEAVRRILSRRLRLLRKPLHVRDIFVGPQFIDVPIGAVVSLSHFSGPHPQGSGWGVKKWQRQPFILLGNDLNHDNWQCRLTLLDLEDFVCGLWDVCQSKISATSQRDGIATLDAGATRTFLRASSAWIVSPAENDSRIVEVAANVEKNSVDGFLLEGSSTNRTLNSCFKDGVFGSWTSEGTGVNGSAIADDTADLFWDSALSTKSCKITAGNPLGGTECGIKQTTASITANTVCSLSITHKDDSGAAIAVRIQRGFDNWYYNAATPGWQSGAVWNDLTVRATAARDDIRGIDVGVNATTITYKIAAENTAGQINHVYDVQFEDKTYPTSRILTQTATKTREDDEFWWSNLVGARTLHPDAHTAFAIVVPSWNTANLPSGAKKTLWYSEKDSNNKIHVYYDEASEQWKYDHVVGGVTNTAYKAQAMVEGTAYEIAIRKTSALAEHDLTAHTISIYVNGAKGTDDISSAFPSDATLLQVGRSAADTNMLDGYIRHLYAAPLARGDEAIARLPQ